MGKTEGKLKLQAVEAAEREKLSSSALTPAGHEEKTLRTLNMLSLLYFAVLLGFSAFITYNGSYTEYSRNSTSLVEEIADLEAMTPIVSVCRLPGFKTGSGANDIDDVFDSDSNDTHKHDMLKEHMLRLEDVVAGATLEKGDMFAANQNMEDGWEDGSRVAIGPERWREVASGSRLVRSP